MTDTWRLDTLPFDVLVLIFNYCHAFDLVRLSEVCTRFYDIIKGETLWIKKSKQPIVTNQSSRKFRERCNPLLCLRTKWHVSHNWRFGRYEKKVIFSQKTKLMPWMQLTSDVLWWSGGNQLCGFKRTKSFLENNLILVKDIIASDICKFVVRNDYIITGHSNGSIQFWTKSKYSETIDFYCSIAGAHTCDVNAIDETCDVLLSASKDGIVKVWRGPVGQKIRDTPLTTINIADKVWSLSTDPTGKKFAVGSAGYANFTTKVPLHIFDIESYSECNILRHECRKGAGVLDMVWDNPQILLTCGYDTHIRKWDLRTGTCVSSWEDPTDATVYCISSDYYNTMITGTQFNCKAVLWDQRHKSYVQFYFMSLNRMSSPVYSVCFDSSRLYGATDQHLVELTFSGYSYKESNYKTIFRFN